MTPKPPSEGSRVRISLLADHPQDSATIARWYFDEWASMAPDITLEKIHAKVAQAIHRDSLPLTLLAHDEHDLVGAAELKFRENRNHPDYEHWLGGVFVSPEHRGRGGSTALITAALEHAVRAGVKHLYLQCEDRHLKLYERHGFKHLHQARHHDLVISIMVWSRPA